MTFSAAAGRACEPNDPLLVMWKAATALRQHRPSADAMLATVQLPTILSLATAEALAQR